MKSEKRRSKRRKERATSTARAIIAQITNESLTGTKRKNAKNTAEESVNIPKAEKDLSGS